MCGMVIDFNFYDFLLHFGTVPTYSRAFAMTISHMMHDIDQSETMINTDKDIAPVVTKPHLLTPQGYVSFLNYKAIWY